MPDAAELPAQRSADGRHGRHFMTATGLQRASLSGGVKNATQRYALPPPAVAVRNLVRALCVLCSLADLIM